MAPSKPLNPDGQPHGQPHARTSLTAASHSYPPFNSKIDHLLGDVKRIEWSHDIVTTAYNPITNFSDPGLACELLHFHLVDNILI
jgi:hypothetical protein